MINSTTIEIENMEFFAYHGCFKEEQVIGNQFVVSLRMVTAARDAIATDRLSDALNYQTAYGLVRDEVAKPSHLLEHVAGRILNALFNGLPLLAEATVKVSKLNPPMGGKIDRVSVTLTRVR